ncbi:carboxypeptidase-like regulatory domain-containing protein [Myxococcus faecalis]|uniref:carboxypeptidase-like regulatory domain-containing protein n=2 Tax=Myxococcus TaxID=32 RepID=UPI003CEB5284
MLTHYVPYLLCMLVLIVTVPVLTRAESREYAPPPGVLLGIVIDGDSGEPLVRVKVSASASGHTGAHVTWTDPAGRYRLPLLPAGTYTLRFEHPDYAPSSRTDILLRANGAIRSRVALRPSSGSQARSPA